MFSFTITHRLTLLYIKKTMADHEHNQ